MPKVTQSHRPVLQRSARSRVWLLALGVIVSTSYGCERKFCVEGLDIGTTYRVTVLEPANAQSQYAVQTSKGPDFGMYVGWVSTCGAGFDFVAGSTFLVRPVARVSPTNCDERIAEVSGLQEVQIIKEPSGLATNGGPLLTSRPFEGQRGGCTGTWNLAFMSPHYDPPLKVPVPGEYPPVLMLRTFSPPPGADIQSCLLPDSELESRPSCEDYFVVKLEKT